MISVKALLSATTLMIAACEPAGTDTAHPQANPAEPQAPLEEQSIAASDLPEATRNKIQHLLKITADGRLTPLVREAEQSESFQSNFGGQSHSRHWFLLRRIGVDPVEKLHLILAGPNGTKKVGTETWYIWPDFAALDTEELIPEKLSFKDRARLKEMIGEGGITRIRNGEPYPGVRTAISESGRWVYFIHDIEGEELEQ